MTKLFHPALPDTSKYFAEQDKLRFRQKVLQRGSQLLLVGLTFYAWGLLILNWMPDPQ